MGNLTAELDEVCTSLDTYRNNSSIPIRLPAEKVTVPEAGDIAEKANFPFKGSYRDHLTENFPDSIPRTEEILTLHDWRYGSCFAERVRKCQNYNWLEQYEDTGAMVRYCNSCGESWCLHCSEQRQKFVQKQAFEFFERQPWVGAMVLTVKHNDKPLKEQIADLTGFRQKLMRSVLVNKSVTGTFWAMQVKEAKHDDGFHPHFHILFTGGYIVQRLLSETWQKITGDSYIVHVRCVRDASLDIDSLGGELSDMCRYVGRAANLLDVALEQGVEIVHARRRIRICGTTGICTEKKGGIVLHHRKGETDKRPTRRLPGTTEMYWDLAVAGNVNAQKMFISADTGKPFTGDGYCEDEIRELMEKADDSSAPDRERARAPPAMLFEPNSYVSGGGWS